LRVPISDENSRFGGTDSFIWKLRRQTGKYNRAQEIKDIGN
jgi:hypothetical protein